MMTYKIVDQRDEWEGEKDAWTELLGFIPGVPAIRGFVRSVWASVSKSLICKIGLLQVVDFHDSFTYFWYVFDRKPAESPTWHPFNAGKGRARSGCDGRSCRRFTRRKLAPYLKQVEKGEKQTRSKRESALNIQEGKDRWGNMICCHKDLAG